MPYWWSFLFGGGASKLVPVPSSADSVEAYISMLEATVEVELLEEIEPVEVQGVVAYVTPDPDAIAVDVSVPEFDVTIEME